MSVPTAPPPSLGSMPPELILHRARDLTKRPPRRPGAVRVEREIEIFRRRTPTSAALHSRARALLARGSQHVDPLSDPYPLFMHRGCGSRVDDVDGNRYVDYILAGGAILLGHNDPELNARVVAVIEEKTNFHGHLDEYELAAAEALCELFGSIEAVRFTASGAEANLAAARIARAFTGHRKIVKFRGAYHGWGDQFMSDLEVPGSGAFMAGGVPEAHMSETVLVDQNDLEGLRRAFVEHRRDGGIAAVICEPVGAESGLVPFVDGFHDEALALAHAFGALYIFDEIVTGFRLGLGGAQARLGVTPDLTTLGKGLMNGYPSCGVVGGRKEIIEAATTGPPRDGPAAYIGGTMSGNVLSVAACLQAVNQARRPGVLDRAIDTAADLVAKLNVLFERRDADFFAYHYGSIVKVELTAPHAVRLDSAEAAIDALERRALLGTYMLPVQNAGVLSRMGRDMVSCAHTPDDNDLAVAAYDALLDFLA
jgi:glutamate-1-semialdehyde aminotransferase